MTETSGSTVPQQTARGRTWLVLVMQVVGGVLLLALAVTAVAIWWLDRSIDRVEVQGLGEVPPDAGIADADEGEDTDHARALTLLVLGSDSRAELTPEQRREYRTGDVPGERMEVIALVRLAPRSQQIRILNVPRDARVERCDGSVGKINGAYGLGEGDGRGGATCTVQTVTDLTGLPVDHVVIVDFAGFVEIVDELGGVTMELEEPLRDDGAHLDLPAGCVDLDGVEALAFARARHLDDDFGRIARQQRLVTELRDEVAEVGILDDLPRLLRVAEAIARAVELDSGLDLGRLQQLVREHRATLRGDMHGRAVPGELATIDGVSYVELDERRLEELSLWLLTGTDPGQIAPDGATERGDDGSSEDAEDGGERSGPADGPLTLEGEPPAGTRPADGGEGC